DKAIRWGVTRGEEAVADEQVYDLIFQPGFSTAETVSEVSGRGVGLDVVRRNITALGGTIDVCSEAGRGTTFTIHLPLTLAILDGQLVRVGQGTYVVPLVSIVESLQVDPALVSAIAGQARLYKLRANYIPMLPLADLFHLRQEAPTLADSLLVVVEGERRKVGLVVDALLGQQQVVIKSLESNFTHVEGISGATILGDGTVALILDIVGLLHLGHRRAEAGRHVA